MGYKNMKNIEVMETLKSTDNIIKAAYALIEEFTGKKKTGKLIATIKLFIDLYNRRLNGEKVTLKPVMDYLITWEMTGKMETMISLSTSCQENNFCKAYRKNKNFICKDCYAWKELNAYSTVRNKAKFSTLILCNVELLPCDIPMVNNRYFRFEAFGDLQTTIQFKNYNLFCIVNDFINCTLWTKNPFIIENALKEFNIVIPENFKIIYSIPELDRKLTAAEKKAIIEKYPFIWYFFAVYSENGMRKVEYGYICKMKCSECNYFCYKHEAPQGTLIQEVKKGNENK